MNELIDTALGVLRALLRFRWTVLATAFVLSLGGWAFVHQMEDVYEARARVYVDTNRVLGPLLQGLAVQNDVEQRVSMMSRTLLNRPNLEKLIRTTDLDVTAGTELERERLLDSVRSRISLDGTRDNASLYSVSYRDSERDRAKRVVQALLTVFIEETLGDKREDSATAQGFLDSQISQLERRLASSEKRLSDFKRENTGLTPGEAGGFYSRLAASRAQAQAAGLELAELQNRRDIISRRLAQEPQTLREEDVLGVSATQAKLDVQRDELDALLVRYTERHPRVSQLRGSIANLEEQALREREAGTTPTRGRGGSIPNPAYQEMRASLTEAEARVAELEVRTREYDRQADEIATTVESIPLVEAQLAQLNRDYEIVRGQYEELLQRRESARLSDDVEQNVDDIQFRIIDPPFVPVRPSAPKKWLLSAGTFVAALGVGGALAFGLSLLRPVYYSPAAVAARSNRAALGSVSAWRTPAQRRATTLSWIVWLGLFALLAGACGLLVLLQRDAIDMATLSRLTGLPLDWYAAELGRVATDAVGTLRELIDRVRP